MPYDLAAGHMTFVIGLVIGLLLIGLDPAFAGGMSFDDDSGSAANDGPSYFGFVRDAEGSAVPDAKVTATVKPGGALVTRSNIMGVYKIPGLGKAVDPANVSISCAKDGFKQTNVVVRPSGDSKDPIEIECYLQKE